MTFDERSGPIAEILDRLGDDAAAETGEPPASRPRSRSIATPRLIAAAVLLLAGAGTVLFIAADEDSADLVVADRDDDATAQPRPAPPESERADVTVEFRRDPERSDLAFIGTVTNHSDTPWSWDCAQGTLSRWSGDEWEVVAEFATWGSDMHLLALREAPADLDCAPPGDDVLAPGATEDRPMEPVWIDWTTGSGTRPLLTPGDYRLSMTGPDDGIVAVGRFTIELRSAADSTTTIAPGSAPGHTNSTEQPDRTDQPASTGCDLVSTDDLAPHLGGVVTFQPTEADGMLAASCTASSESTSLVYRHLTAEEYHAALEGSDIDPSTYIGERPVDGADDSVIALFPGTGRTSATVLGMILVGENGLVFDLRGGDDATLSAAGIELAPVLAHRLREHHG